MGPVAALRPLKVGAASALGIAITVLAAGACTPNGPLAPAAATSASASASAAPTSLPSSLPSSTAPQVFRCSRVEFTAAAPAAVEAGDPVTFTAAAYGCDPADYRFLWFQPDTGDWQVAQDWSRSADWTWDTWAFSPARYSIVVDARARYELGNDPDVSISTAIFLTEPAAPAPPSPGRAGACLSVTVTPSLTSPVQAGSLVFYKVAASGCSDPEYRFSLVDLASGVVTLARGWGPSPDGVWDTKNTAPGSYAIRVDARQSGPNLAGYVLDTWAQAEIDVRAR
jgi:hypothetical protein